MGDAQINETIAYLRELDVFPRGPFKEAIETAIQALEQQRAQRDELLEAAKRIRPEHNKLADWWRLQAAIAKAEDDGPDTAA